MKSCTKCRRELPLSSFYKDKGRLASQCRDCKIAYIRAYREANPEKSRESRLRSNRKTYPKVRAYRLQWQYGITREDYEVMLLAQGGRCAICGEQETARANNGQQIMELAVDHDHVTGQVRALLCSNCNKGIGNLRDDPDILQAAADYLRKYKEIRHG